MAWGDSGLLDKLTISAQENSAGAKYKSLHHTHHSPDPNWKMCAGIMENLQVIFVTQGRDSRLSVQYSAMCEIANREPLSVYITTFLISPSKNIYTTCL